MRGSWGTARLIAVALVVLGALTLVALAARSERAATVTVVPSASASAPVGSPVATRTPAPGAGEEGRTRDTSSDSMVRWLVWTMIVVSLAPVVLAAIFLPALVWMPRVQLWWRTRRAPAPAEPPPVDDEVPARRLAAAVEEGLRELDQGGPGEGVVAAWVMLERAAADAGTHRAAPETPSELAGRLIDRHAVASGPLLRLADLYREARFSSHRLPEEARAEARRALEQLQAELAASPIGGRR